MSRPIPLKRPSVLGSTASFVGLEMGTGLYTKGGGLLPNRGQPTLFRSLEHMLTSERESLPHLGECRYQWRCLRPRRARAAASPWIPARSWLERWTGRELRTDRHSRATCCRIGWQSPGSGSKDGCAEPASCCSSTMATPHFAGQGEQPTVFGRPKRDGPGRLASTIPAAGVREFQKDPPEPGPDIRVTYRISTQVTRRHVFRDRLAWQDRTNLPCAVGVPSCGTRVDSSTRVAELLPVWTRALLRGFHSLGGGRKSGTLSSLLRTRDGDPVAGSRPRRHSSPPAVSGKTRCAVRR